MSVPEEFLRRFEALEGEVKSLKESFKGFKPAEPSKHEKETDVCPWCGQLASKAVLDKRAKEVLEKPLAVIKEPVIVEKERVIEKPIEKPVEKVVEKPAPVDLEALARRVFKPGSLTPEAGEALKALYEAGRREGLFR